MLGKWKCASSLIIRLFGRFGFSINIFENDEKNCKRTSLSRSLQEGTIWNLYGWRFKSLCRMCRTLCQTSFTLVRAYLQVASDCGRRTPKLESCSRVCELRTADQVSSSRHCPTHWRISFGDGAPRPFIEWRYPHAFSTMDPVRINISTAYTLPNAPSILILKALD